jgi:transposase-like protein
LSTNEPIRFSHDFKLEAQRPMKAGENVSVLARELGFARKSIYQWRDHYRSGSSNALRGRGRMTKAERSGHEEKLIAEQWTSASNRSSSIVFSKPCGKSGDGACDELAPHPVRRSQSDPRHSAQRP